MTDLLIVGAGGHGRVVADAAIASGQWTGIAWIDDSMPRGSLVDGFPVVGSSGAIPELRQSYGQAVVAIGDAHVRLLRLTELLDNAFVCPIVVHPGAIVARSATFGAGTVVLAGAVLAVGVRFGRGCIANHGATIDHDCVIADGAHICPGAHLAGGVHVGQRTWIGIGASVIQEIRVGADVIVGAGAAVVTDISDGETFGGVPARSLVGKATSNLP